MIILALLYVVAAHAASPVADVTVDLQGGLEKATAEKGRDSEIRLDLAGSKIPPDARALVLVDSRLHAWIRRDLTAYVTAAAARRKSPIGVLAITR
jgi:hypothetical protein